MVSIPQGKESAVSARAKELNRSVANYIETLLIDDLNAVSESRAAYTTKADDSKEPDKTQRHRGEGHRRAVSKSA